jgi:MFS transporter, DHA1 family, multidrug resistance protein
MRKDVIFLCVSVFLLTLGTYVAGTTLTPYAESLGATNVFLGLIISSLYIVRLFTGVSIGKWADRKGSLKILTYSLSLYPFIAILYWIAFNSWTLLGARLLHGLASAMMLPIAMAYIGDASPLNKEAHYMGAYNMTIFIASGLGPQIATIVAANYGLKSVFIVLFLLAIVALFLILLQRNKIHNNIIISDKINKDFSIKTDFSWKNSRLIALSSINIAMAVVLSLMGFFFIKFSLSHKVDLISIGLLLALYNLVTGLVQIPLGKMLDCRNKYLFTLSAGIILSLLLLIIPMFKSFYLMILLIIILGILSAIVISASSALSISLGRSIGMNSTMGFLGTATSVGMILGCIFLSIMPGIFGDGSIFYISGIIFLSGVIIFAFLWINPINKLLNEGSNDISL